MAVYIDREKVFELLTDIYEHDFVAYDLSYWEHNEEIKTMIAEIPAADVRPVVRGEDCVYAHSAKRGGELMCYRLGSDYPRPAICKTCKFGTDEDAAWEMYHLCSGDGGGTGNKNVKRRDKNAGNENDGREGDIHRGAAGDGQRKP